MTSPDQLATSCQTLSADFEQGPCAQERYETIVADGPESAVAIFDLDGLLALKQSSINPGESITSWHILRQFMTPAGRGQHTKRLRRYGASEYGATIDPADSRNWTLHVLELLVAREDENREPVSVAEIENAARMMEPMPGARELIDNCVDSGIIPVLSTAAPEPIARGFIRHAGLRIKHEHIIASKLIVSKGLVTAVDVEHVVHSTNKDAFPHVALPGCEDRGNAIVSGDNILDAKAALDTPSNHNIKILHDPANQHRHDENFYNSCFELGIDLVSTRPDLFGIASLITGIGARRRRTLI